MYVILDPGHCSKTSGKCSPDCTLREYLWARELCTIIEGKLDRVGIEHTRTTTPDEDDTEISLSTRCKRANTYYTTHSPSILVSVHCNAASSDGQWHSAHGWSVFVSNNASTNSKNLACYMTDAAISSGIHVRQPSSTQKYWVQNLAICRDTKMPAVLVENMFQDNKEDVEYLLSDEGKENLANIIISGIESYIENN